MFVKETKSHSCYVVSRHSIKIGPFAFGGKPDLRVRMLPILRKMLYKRRLKFKKIPVNDQKSGDVLRAFV